MDSDRTGGAGYGAALIGRAGVADVIGVVVAQLPSGLYHVKVEAGSVVTAHIADRVERNFIRVLVGDRVRVELSPVDLARGRIVERL